MHQSFHYDMVCDLNKKLLGLHAILLHLWAVLWETKRRLNDMCYATKFEHKQQRIQKSSNHLKV